MMNSRDGNMNLALCNTKAHLWKYRPGMKMDATLRLAWRHKALGLVDSSGVGGGGEDGAATFSGS